MKISNMLPHASKEEDDDDDEEEDALSSSEIRNTTETIHKTQHQTEFKKFQQSSPVSRSKDNSDRNFLMIMAEKRAQEIHENNFLISNLPDSTDSFPKFSHEELREGPVLGKGSFATVFEVRGFGVDTNSPTKQNSNKKNLARPYDEEVTKGEMESRMFVANHCFRNNGDARYAVKKVSHNIADTPDRFMQAICDLAGETRLLANLEHPHIIKLRAISTEPRFCKDFCIVLDRLYDILDHRMSLWNHDLKKFNGFFWRDFRGKKKAALYQQRLYAAYHLSSALCYLHHNRIIHRDLKPENIGFDVRGDIKLFDFGLSRELPSLISCDPHGLYRMTAKTGSPRYMAPEVALDKPYNESCDVYSFSILLWEMLTLRIAFGAYSNNGLYRNVYRPPHKRPLINKSWHSTLKKLMHYMWSPQIDQRPKMVVVKSVLKEECSDFPDYDEEISADDRRRSSFVYDKSKRRFRRRNSESSRTAAVLDSNYLFEEHCFWKSVAASSE